MESVKSVGEPNRSCERCPFYMGVYQLYTLHFTLYIRRCSPCRAQVVFGLRMWRVRRPRPTKAAEMVAFTVNPVRRVAQRRGHVRFIQHGYAEIWYNMRHQEAEVKLPRRNKCHHGL